jgi:hypothetical protein
VEDIPFDNSCRGSWRWTATVIVLVDVDIAATSREFIVFCEAEVVMLVAAAASVTATSSAASATTPSSHALESVAIPSLSTDRTVVDEAQIACGSPIRHDWRRGRR